MELPAGVSGGRPSPGITGRVSTTVTVCRPGSEKGHGRSAVASLAVDASPWGARGSLAHPRAKRLSRSTRIAGSVAELRRDVIARSRADRTTDAQPSSRSERSSRLSSAGGGSRDARIRAWRLLYRIDSISTPKLKPMAKYT